MTAPKAAVRGDTYKRDLFRCASCGRRDSLEWQHRRAVGMGGSKILPLICDGLTSCAVCNPGYEAALQGMALKFGWKVKSWVKEPARVPVYYLVERQWCRLTLAGEREPISWVTAMEMMRDVYGDAYSEEKGLVR